MGTIKSVALSKLVEDFALYPRHRVDDTHVLSLYQALRAEQELPPIVADAASLRVADGFHRRRAFIRFLGPDAKVKVELRHYATEAELFLDAVQLNSHHGRRLDRHDQSRIVLRLRELQVDDRTISVALHVPVKEIKTLSVRVVYDQGGSAVPLKRGLEHMRGASITDQQLSVLKSVRSAEIGRLCLELSRLLDARMVDLTDEDVVERLRVAERSILAALEAVAA